MLSFIERTRPAEYTCPTLCPGSTTAPFLFERRLDYVLGRPALSARRLVSQAAFLLFRSHRINLQPFRPNRRVPRVKEGRPW